MTVEERSNIKFVDACFAHNDSSRPFQKLGLGTPA